MNLTQNFKLQEFTKSNIADKYGINNSVPDELMPNIQLIAVRLEQIRNLLNAPIVITSGYRCRELNNKVGGAPDSDHVKGLAVDIKSKYGTPKQICEAIMKSDILYDKLILEFGDWVHISFNPNVNRKKNMTAKIIDGKTTYLNGIA